ncbi:hypothetical protein [Streptomyces sp. LaPpAH-108]|nr:hypothetical protein [Streptomyces sp. LaPpAH-108]
MGDKEPNAGLARLLDETGGKHAQLACQANAVGTETGTPFRYDESAVS